MPCVLLALLVARLGLLLWGLRGFLLWFYLNDLINNQGHLDISDVDSAKANFWANIGTLYKEQSKNQNSDKNKQLKQWQTR